MCWPSPIQTPPACPPDKWRKLIHLEGSPTQAEDDARGGSYGLGKNAPFNLSEVNTVFYTSCLWQDEQADYQHRSIGKAQLATHKDPEDQDRNPATHRLLCPPRPST